MYGNFSIKKRLVESADPSSPENINNSTDHCYVKVIFQQLIFLRTPPGIPDMSAGTAAVL